MRVLIACDGVAGLDSAAAGEVIGTAFAEQGAQVAVYPMAAGGPALTSALRRLIPSVGLHSPTSLAEVLDVLRQPVSGPQYLDLTHLPELSVDDVVAAIDPTQWAARRGTCSALVAVVPDGEAELPLTGMPGIIAARGRRDGTDLGETLAADARAAAWLERLSVEPEPGTGAAGGVGALVRFVGGTVLDGVDACAHAGGLPQVMGKADVVVTGAEQLDFHAVGGPVVKAVSALGEAALRPVIAVVGRSFVSPRELRLAGIESAYPVLDGPGEKPPSVEQLRTTAHKVARTWRW